MILQENIIYKNTQFTDLFKPVCLCKFWNCVLALFKGEVAVNELGTLNTVFVYLNIDSSVSIVIKLRAGYFDV